MEQQRGIDGVWEGRCRIQGIWRLLFLCSCTIFVSNAGEGHTMSLVGARAEQEDAETQ